MTPVIFINSSKIPFVDLIGSGSKPFETRTRNMLGRFIGERILIAETGKGSPVIRFSAVIDYAVEVHTRSAWERYRQDACIPVGSKYDWNENTKVKWLYHLTDVRMIGPVPLPQDARRHGRTWAEYDGEIPC